MAFGFARRFDARCRRSGRQPHGVRLSGRLAGSQRVPATALRLVAGERHARETGAHLLWRAKKHLRLDVLERFADGSYRSAIYASEADRRKRRRPLAVRVIEYQFEGIDDAEEFYRLLTTILDPAQAPAVELAALYSERWEIEGALDELKTHLRGARIVLRSKTPELVRQEFYGLLMAHFAIRRLMHEAALRADEDPDRLSYLHAVRVVRRKLSRAVAIPPSGQGSV